MGKYKNEFLKAIGYNESASSWILNRKSDDKRRKIWREERKKWGGWDSRVAWNLNTFILENLYTWLKIYYKRADKVIDLNYYSFEINGETLTQKECILRMIKDLKFVLLNNADASEEVQNKVQEKAEDCFNILGKCIFAMWY